MKQKILYKKPWLVIAPHLSFPLRNGGDIYTHRLAKFGSLHVPYVDLISECTITRFKDGEQVSEKKFKNQMRNKKAAAFFSFFTFSHYRNAKFLKRGYKKIAADYYNSPEYGTILYSLIFSLELFNSKNEAERNHLVITQNDDIQWFTNAMQHSSNPIGKWLNYQAVLYSRRMINRFADKAVFLTITSADARGYQAFNKEVITANYRVGCDVNSTNQKLYSSPAENKQEIVTLSFVGSLFVGMNIDALQNFKDVFWPILKQEFGNNIRINIAGSNPAESVKAICQEVNWNLFPDISNDNLAELMAQTDFTILPYNYSAGAKLKLLFSLGRGVPLLATTCSADPDYSIAVPCLLSDDPLEWVMQLKDKVTMSRDNEVRMGLLNYSNRFSWQVSVEEMMHELDGLTFIK